MPRVGDGDGRASRGIAATSLQVFKPLADVAEGALVKAFLIVASFFVFRMTDAPVKGFVLPVRANGSW